MNLVFAADSIWNWEAERNFKLLMEENPELVKAARRGDSVVDAEDGIDGEKGGETRRMSLFNNSEKDRQASLTPRGKN